MATPILVTGAAGRVGGIGRTAADLLLKRGKAVRAMVRTEDERSRALRDMGAEVVVGDLLDLDSMHRAVAGCDMVYFGMSVSDAYLAATAEELARRIARPPPSWIDAESRRLRRPWFASPLAALRAVLLLESPPGFRARNLFVSENALTRA